MTDKEREEVMQMAEINFEKMAQNVVQKIKDEGVFISRWIPVSEGLPEKDELYLVYFDDGEYDLVYFGNGAFSYSGVIAWMPLPEPYEP